MAKKVISVDQVIAAMVDEGLTQQQANAFYAWAESMVDRSAAIARISEGVMLSQALPVVGPAGQEMLSFAQQARTLAKGLVEGEARSLAIVIKEGLEEGLHPHQVAARLDMVRGLNSNQTGTYLKTLRALEQSDLSDDQLASRADREFQKLLGQRKKLIANTEMNNAMSYARHQEAKSGKAIGKYWITVGDSRVSDGCMTNEAQGVVGMEEAFWSGHDNTPRFPGCRCTVGYVYSDDQKERAEADIQQHIENVLSAKGV